MWQKSLAQFILWQAFCASLSWTIANQESSFTKWINFFKIKFQEDIYYANGSDDVAVQ